MDNIMKISVTEFVSYRESIREALDNINAGKTLSLQTNVLIKPNLINSSPPPITTPVECVEVVIHYIRSYTNANIIIAEGCGASDYDTEKVFCDLGYVELSESLNVPLINLNTEKTILLKNEKCRFFKEFHMPEIAMNHFIISVPVLKAHSLAIITGSLKNMMGFAPPRYYQAGGHWKKSLFHQRMHESIEDLNIYRHADLTIMDASIGLPEYHLGGRECDPPLNKIIAGYDPLEIDRIGAGLLGLNWEDIPHLYGND